MKKLWKGVLASVMAASVAMSATSMLASAAWEKTSTGTWNWIENGQKATGWKMVNGTWYYMDQNGEMQTGWVFDGKNWYYMQNSGAMTTGWVKTNNQWYYLNNWGGMATGWVKTGDTWYFLQPSGAMATGWVKSGNEWYHMDNSGAMQTGFYEVDGKTYFSSAKGDMQTGVVEVDGKVYYFGEENDGAMKTGYVKIDGKLYRFDETGECTSSVKPAADVAFNTSDTGSVAPVEPTVPEKPAGGGSVIIPPVVTVDVVEVTDVAVPTRDGGSDEGKSNIGKYTVNAANHTITIQVNQALTKHESDSGMGEAEWVGVLITTDVEITSLEYNGLQLGEEDITEATEVGATGRNTFVLWLKAEDLRNADRTITLNAAGKDEPVEVTITLSEASESLKAINAVSEKNAMRSALETYAEDLGLDMETYNQIDESRKPSVANYVLDSMPAGGFASEAALKAAFDAGVAYETAKWDFSTKLMENSLSAGDFEAIEAAYNAHAAYRSSIGKPVTNEAIYKVAKDAIAYVLNAGDGQTAIINALQEQFADENNNAAAGTCTNPYRINDVFAWLRIHEVDGLMGELPESDSFQYENMSQYFAVRDAKWQMEQEVKAAVSSINPDNFYVAKTNYDAIVAFAEDWWTEGNGVTVSSIEYDAEENQIVITTSEEVKYVDDSRLFVNSANGSVALAGVSTEISGTTITIDLGAQAENVANLVEAAGGVGNTWVHYGEGAFLVDKGVPNKGDTYDTAMKAAPKEIYVEAEKTESNDELELQIPVTLPALDENAIMTLPA